MKFILSAFIFSSFLSFASKARHPPRYRGPYAKYPFHQAVYAGDIEKVNQLIKTEDVNQRDRDGKAPIHWAIQKEPPEIISPFHHKRFVDPKNKNSDVYVKIISVLIKNGADIEIRDDKRDKTALMFAAEIGDKNIIKALLEQGANIDAQNQYGETALSHAIHRCCNPNGEIVSF